MPSCGRDSLPIVLRPVPGESGPTRATRATLQGPVSIVFARVALVHGPCASGQFAGPCLTRTGVHEDHSVLTSSLPSVAPPLRIRGPRARQPSHGTPVKCAFAGSVAPRHCSHRSHQVADETGTPASSTTPPHNNPGSRHIASPRSQNTRTHISSYPTRLQVRVPKQLSAYPDEPGRNSIQTRHTPEPG